MRRLLSILGAAALTIGLLQGQIPLPGGGGGGGGGATIPSTTNLIKGDGAGNGADSGIAPTNVATQAANGTSGGVPCYTAANKALVSSGLLAAGGILGGGGAGVCPSVITALPSGTTATTQSQSDNSTKIATTAYADAVLATARAFTQVDRSYAANCVSAVAGAAWNTTLTPACVGGSNNLGGYLPFVDTSVAQFQWEIPGDWATATQPYITVYFASGSNTTGTVIFTVALACTKSDGSVTWDPAFNAADTLATKTMAAASREWSTNVQVTQMTSGNNCLPGGTAIFKITRTTDTAASAVNVDKAVISTLRTISTFGPE